MRQKDSFSSLDIGYYQFASCLNQYCYSDHQCLMIPTTLNSGIKPTKSASLVSDDMLPYMQTIGCRVHSMASVLFCAIKPNLLVANVPLFLGSSLVTNSMATCSVQRSIPGQEVLRRLSSATSGSARQC